MTFRMNGPIHTPIAIAVLAMAWVGSTPSRGQDNPGPLEGIHITVNGGGTVTATMTITAGPGGAAATQPDGFEGTGPATRPSQRAVQNVAGRTVRSTTQPTAAPLGAAPGTVPGGAAACS